MTSPTTIRKDFQMKFVEWMHAEALMEHKYLTPPCKGIRMEWERRFNKYCNGVQKRDECDVRKMGEVMKPVTLELRPTYGTEEQEEALDLSF